MIAGLLLLLLSIIIKSAWLGDDFYIGVRSFDNLLNGYGLRWNVLDRVQVFTDPLWYLVLTPFYAITGEVFITTIVLSIVTSLAAIGIVVRFAASTYAAAAAALLVLVSSKAFVDYTTSGLENCLSFLLAGLFCVVLGRTPVSRRMLQQLIALAALTGLNRLDLMLMLAPAVLWVTWLVLTRRLTTWRALLRGAFVCSAPLWVWLLFSTIYFGFPLPNTYYAKLHTGIPRGPQMVQGILYYINSINFDPATLLAIGFALFALVLSREQRFVAGAIGVILYLLYVFKIGGDFMSGRFFSVPLLFSLALLVQLRLRLRTWIAVAVLCVTAGLMAPAPTLLYHENAPVAGEQLKDHRGIADERAVYYGSVGLLPVLRHNNSEPWHGWVGAGREARGRRPQLVVFGTPGMYAYYAGPKVHVIDFYGLSDPLLSRLPIMSPEGWRVGHYARAIPDGYIESIQTGENLIKDRATREVYRAIKIVVQGPIWSWARFKEIVKLNIGSYGPSITAAGQSAQVKEPPPDIETYPRDASVDQPAAVPLNATVRATWDRESDGFSEFWWTDTEVVIEFALSRVDDPAKPMIIPVLRYGRDVGLQFIVNGSEAEAHSLPSSSGSAFIPMVVRGPWNQGPNKVIIKGSGEPVKPPSDDPRRLLFAVRRPAWQ
ncbi:MAG: hypothetical protein H0W20_06120 [Chthoniobacterales bacterium]|nr:hypothetical protein [Chthoniobacterales bacterium]